MKTKLTLLLTTILFIVLLTDCKTVQKVPYYVADTITIVKHDTVIIRFIDTLKMAAKAPIYEPAIIDNEHLFSKAWVEKDSINLIANLKPQKDTIHYFNTTHEITNTPEPVIIYKPQYVYKNSDRFLENMMYYSGWIFYCLLAGAIIGFILKIVITKKI